MDAGIMRIMSDEHLASAAHAEIDSLTSTPLEIELLNRFERFLDEASVADADLEDVVSDFGITGAALRELCEAHPASMTEITAMLAMLNDLEIFTPTKLRQQLDIAAGFETLAFDAGDIFARLDILTAETTKETV